MKKFFLLLFSLSLVLVEATGSSSLSRPINYLPTLSKGRPDGPPKKSDEKKSQNLNYQIEAIISKKITISVLCTAKNRKSKF